MIRVDGLLYYVPSGDFRRYVWNAWLDKYASGTPTISTCVLGSRIFLT